MPVINPLKLDLVLGSIILVSLALIVFNHRRRPLAAPEKVAGLGLRELIKDIKSDLAKSEEERLEAGENPVFKVEDVDLEINFVINKQYAESGGIEYKFVTLGNQSQISSEKVQKITLHMKAIQPEDRPVRPAGDLSKSPSQIPLAVPPNAKVITVQPASRQEK
jgi:Trypsin-co-occurring domain 2